MPFWRQVKKVEIHGEFGAGPSAGLGGRAPPRPTETLTICEESLNLQQRFLVTEILMRLTW